MKRPGVPKQMLLISSRTGGGEKNPGIQQYRTGRPIDMTTPLKAPFPYPGGKSTIAPAVWARFGTVENYVEAFCGSSAMLLGRPGGAHGTETANDADGFITNAYRAIQFDPEQTAALCDWPVSEACLTASHLWLKQQRPDLTERLFADPFYFDPLVAARWLWGAASWIGDGWCVADGPWVNVNGRLVDRRTLPEGEQDTEGVGKRMPIVSAGDVKGGGYANVGGIQEYRYRAAVPRKMPEVGKSPNGQIGFNRKGIQALRYGVPKQMPEVGVGHPGRNRDGSGNKTTKGVVSVRYEPAGALASYFAALSDRLRRVRFLCGDWRRCVKDSITVNHGLTALFLDPPYPSAEHGMGYHGDNDIWFDVAKWAAERGDDPRLRIAVCGYMSEAADALFPPSWTRYAWEARGGYSNQSADGRGRANAKREMVWFSPHCIDPAKDYNGTLFEGLL